MRLHILKQEPIDAKVLVHMPQMQTSIIDKSANVHIDLWLDPDTIHKDPDIYFEVSALLKRDQNFGLPSVDSEQAVTPKIFSFSSWFLMLLLLNMPKHNSRLKGSELEQHDAAHHSACSTLLEYVAKDPDKAGEVWPGSDPGILTVSSKTVVKQRFLSARCM